MTCPFKGYRPNVSINANIPSFVDKLSQNNKNEEISNLDLIQNFFEQKNIHFVQDSDLCYYIYCLESQFSSQTGLIALMSLDNASHQIFPHEQTEVTKINKYCEFIERTNIQANPVILLHRFSKAIQTLIDEITISPPLINVSTTSKCTHKLWTIHHPDLIKKISQCYGAIGKYYIADGHHRYHAAKTILNKRGEYQLLSWLVPECQTYSLPCYWAIPTLNSMNKAQFLKRIAHNFDVALEPDFVVSQKCDELAMYLGKSWYLLRLKKFKNLPNIAIFLDNVLRKELKLTLLSMQVNNIEFPTMFETFSHQVGFLLPSINASEILKNIDSGGIFPVNTTYFVPKPAIGLISYLSQ